MGLDSIPGDCLDPGGGPGALLWTQEQMETSQHEEISGR